jgi:hypothetical protein
MLMAQSIANTTSLKESEMLLDELKQSLVQRAVNSGLSVASAGFIDSTGRLVESTYFNTGTNIEAIRNVDLMKDRRPQRNEITRLLDSARNNDCERKSTARYRKKIGIVFKDAAWSQDISGAVINRLDGVIGEQLRLNINSTSQWYVTEGRQTASVPSSTSYFSRLNERNENVEAGQYLVSVDVSIDQKKFDIADTYRLSRIVGADIVSNISSSRFLYNLAKPKYSDSKRLLVTLTASDRDKNESIAVSQFTINIPKAGYNLLEQEIDTESYFQVQREVEKFSMLLSNYRVCGLEEMPVRGLLRNDSQASTLLRLAVGSTAGVAIGDKFIVSPNILSDYDSLLDPNALDRIGLAEVIRVNYHNAELKILAGDSLGVYRSATPF